MSSTLKRSKLSEEERRERKLAYYREYNATKRIKPSEEQKAERRAYDCAYQRRRRRTHLGKSASRAVKLKQNYGISIEDYELMLMAQGGKCAICGSADTGTTKSDHFFVDHCHSTNHVRGLLCHHCNLGLGNFKDNPRFLAEAITYLEDRTP